MNLKNITFCKGVKHTLFVHCSFVSMTATVFFLVVFFFFDKDYKSEILTMLRKAMSKVMRPQRTTTNSRSTALVKTARDRCLTHWAFRGILERNFFNKKQKRAQFYYWIHLITWLFQQKCVWYSKFSKFLILQNITQWYFLVIKMNT